MALEFFTSELGNSPGYTQERDFLFHVLKTAIDHWSIEVDQDQTFCIHYETVLKQKSQQNIQMQSLISITLERNKNEWNAHTKEEYNETLFHFDKQF